jgi:hypothetical protein
MLGCGKNKDPLPTFYKYIGKRMDYKGYNIAVHEFGIMWKEITLS